MQNSMAIGISRAENLKVQYITLDDNVGGMGIVTILNTQLSLAWSCSRS